MLAVLVFIFSDFQNNSQRDNALFGADAYNCALASSTANSIESSPSSVPTRRFYTEIYIENLGFTHQIHGQEVSQRFADRISFLDAMNEQIALTQDEIITRPFSSKNYDSILSLDKFLKNNSYEYFVNYCDGQ